MNTISEIKTFEDACAYLDVHATIPDLSSMPEKYQKPLLAHYKLCIIAEAINKVENGGNTWTPDWDNGQWDKYYPWFRMSSSSGSGFSCGDYDHWLSDSNCGSRLCFKSRSAAEYAGTQFLELYKDYFLI